MITLTLFNASRTHLIFDISVYTDANTDAWFNAAIETNVHYSLQASMPTFTLASTLALGVIRPLTRKYWQPEVNGLLLKAMSHKLGSHLHHFLLSRKNSHNEKKMQ